MLGLLHRPTRAPRLSTRLDHASLHEGQGTTSRLRASTDADDVEHVTRVAARAPYVAMRPHVRQRRCAAAGRRPRPTSSSARAGGDAGCSGDEKVALTTPWAGYRLGPVPLGGQQMPVLPATAPYDSRAEAPAAGRPGRRAPLARPGGGTEFAGHPAVRAGRPAAPDQLAGLAAHRATLHVVTTRAEEDTGVLLVVDALADHGASGGVDGDAEQPRPRVRAASALAEHHVRTRRPGRPAGGRPRRASWSATAPGTRHLRRIQRHRWPASGPATSREADAERARSSASPAAPWSSCCRRCSARVDGAAAATLHPARACRCSWSTRCRPTCARRSPRAPTPGWPRSPGGCAASSATTVLQRLAALGCPVVPWRGPGTLDDVLRRLARRAQLPRVVADEPRWTAGASSPAASWVLRAADRRSGRWSRCCCRRRRAVAAVVDASWRRWSCWPCGFAAFPESAVGAGARCWSCSPGGPPALDDGLHPVGRWSRPPRCSPPTSPRVLASYGPGECRSTRALVRLWVRRGAGRAARRTRWSGGWRGCCAASRSSRASGWPAWSRPPGRDRRGGRRARPRASREEPS